MLFYIDDFSTSVDSYSHWGNIRRLQRIFTDIFQRGKDLAVSFTVSKTELIHWQTPSQKTSHTTAPIEQDGHLFHPFRVVRWLSYCLSPALTPTHYSRH